MTAPMPGPWRVEGDAVFAPLSRYADVRVATVRSEANAHLIAASPQLLEALEEMARFLEMGALMPRDGLVLSMRDKLNDWHRAALAALAAARGEVAP